MTEDRAGVPIEFSLATAMALPKRMRIPVGPDAWFWSDTVIPSGCVVPFWATDGAESIDDFFDRANGFCITDGLIRCMGRSPARQA